MDNSRRLDVNVFLICVIIGVASIVMLILSNRPPSYTLMASLVLLALFTTAIVLWKYRQRATLARYVLLLGKMLIYTAIMITTPYAVTTSFALPLVIAFSLYGDLTLTGLSCFILIAANASLFNKGLVTIELAVAVSSVVVTTVVALINAGQTRKSNQHLQNQFQSLEEKEAATRQNLKEIVTAVVRLEDSFQRLNFLNQETSQLRSSLTSAISEMSQSNYAQSEEIESVVKHMKALDQKISSGLQDTTMLSQAVVTLTEANHLAVQAAASLDKSSLTVQQTFTQTKDSLTDFNQRLDHINQLSERIQSIADQTNLLALNASIEAARAGEAGRGFAVVANSIRDLATSSRETVEEINTSLSNIQQGFSQLNTTITTTDQQLAEQQENIHQNAQSSATIREATKQVAATSQQLNAIMNLVTKLKEEVMTNMQRLQAISEENAATSQEIDASLLVFNENALQSESVKDDVGSAASALRKTTHATESEMGDKMIAVTHRIADYLNKGADLQRLVEAANEQLGAIDIFVVDHDFTIIASNLKNALGFTFSDDPSHQTYPFYQMIQQGTQSYAQEMRIREIDNTCCKIVAVKRQDGKGIVQTCLTADDLISFDFDKVLV